MVLSWVDSAHPLPLPTWGHLANSGDILALTVRVGGLLPSEVWRPEMLNFWRCIRCPCRLLLPTTANNFSTQNGNGAQLRNPDQHSSFLLILLRVMFPSLWNLLPVLLYSSLQTRCLCQGCRLHIRPLVLSHGWWSCLEKSPRPVLLSAETAAPAEGGISPSLGLSRWLVLSTHLCKDTPSVLCPSHHDP